MISRFHRTLARDRGLRTSQGSFVTPSSGAPPSSSSSPSAASVPSTHHLLSARRCSSALSLPIMTEARVWLVNTSWLADALCIIFLDIVFRACCGRKLGVRGFPNMPPTLASALVDDHLDFPSDFSPFTAPPCSASNDRTVSNAPGRFLALPPALSLPSPATPPPAAKGSVPGRGGWPRGGRGAVATEGKLTLWSISIVKG
mmetsp:Transcript_50979/g.123583  ORF Transcript_50979/g.123583 Transcript_50979/m.123583 type:complete len:201 (-) Transcript_50979:175-777(-)